jgi:hypothetical protein
MNPCTVETFSPPLYAKTDTNGILNPNSPPFLLLKPAFGSLH